MILGDVTIVSDAYVQDGQKFVDLTHPDGLTKQTKVHENTKGEYFYSQCRSGRRRKYYFHELDTKRRQSGGYK